MSLVRDAVDKLATDGVVAFLHSAVRYPGYRLNRTPLYVRARHRVRRLVGNAAVADPFKKVRLSPRRIEQYLPEFGYWESVGLVDDGDWERSSVPVEEMKKYRAVREHFREGVSWEETGIIDHLCRRLREEDRTVIDGCRNRAEIRERYERIDELYADLRENGYREDRHGRMDYVAVHVGRDGEFFFGGSGCHRLSLAKLLDIEEIPVWIRARHEAWQAVRNELEQADSTAELDGRVRRHLGHPDLEDVRP